MAKIICLNLIVIQTYNPSKQNYESPILTYSYAGKPNLNDEKPYHYLENQTLHVGILPNNEGAIELTLSDFNIAISKYGTNIPYVAKYNGIMIDEDDVIKLNYGDSDGELEIVYYDNIFYSPSGDLINQSKEYNLLIKVKIENPIIPPPLIEFEHKSDYLFVKSGWFWDYDYSEAIAVFDGLVIKVWDGEKYIPTEFDGNYIPNTQNDYIDKGLSISFVGGSLNNPTIKQKNNKYYFVNSGKRNNKDTFSVIVKYKFSISGHKEVTAEQKFDFSKDTRDEKM